MEIIYIGGLLCAVFSLGALANGFNPPRLLTIVVAPLALLPWVAFLNYGGLTAIPALTGLGFILSFIGVGTQGDIDKRNHRDFLLLRPSKDLRTATSTKMSMTVSSPRLKR